MSASLLLRAARQAHGTSQRELAEAASVSQPGIAAIESGAHDTTVSRLELLLAALGQRVVLVPTVCRSVAEAADGIRSALVCRDENWAWREVIQTSDDLAREAPVVRVALSIVRPLPVGDQRYDALLAAVVDYWLTRDQLPRPRWLDHRAFTLDEPWDVEQLAELREHARSTTPTSISRHGVYFAATELAST